MGQHTAILIMADQSRVWSVDRRYFQWPWTTPTPSFKVTPFFDAEYLINGTTNRHSFNEIPIGTYTRPTQQCDFEWPWVTLQNIQWHEASRGLSATVELLVFLCPNVLDLTISVGSTNKQTRLFNEIANYFENNVNVHACMLTTHSNNKLKANKLS